MTLRYQETGEVHIDFHRSTNGTIAYLRKTYGREFLAETFRRMANDVYASLHRDLQDGNMESLVEHWTHFFDREGGRYALERTDDEVRFVVHQCPAICYLQSRGIEIDPSFCEQTVVINQTLAENTPYVISTEVLGGGKCVQSIRRRTAE